MNTAEFGQKIKAKYPQYNNIDDAELGQRTLKKYPQYSSSVDSDQSTVVPRREVAQFKRPMQQTGLGGVFQGALGFDPSSLIQNIGTGLQREESAYALAGEEALSSAEEGRFKKPKQIPGVGGVPVSPMGMAQSAGSFVQQNVKPLVDVGKEFWRGASGQEASEIGDIARRRGVSEGKSAALGFLGSMALPSNIALALGTGGAGKSATVRAGKTIGQVPAGVVELAANVKKQPVKRLRNILDRLGKKKLWGDKTGSRVGTPEFVGDTLAPRFSEKLKRGAEELDPNVLRYLKIPEETIENAVRIKKKYGIEKLPTEAEASSIYEKIIQQLPEDFTVDLKRFKGQLGRVLKEAGVIDDTGKIAPGIADDSGTITKFIRMYQKLQQRIRLSKPERVRRLIGQKEVKPLPGSRVTAEGTIRGTRGSTAPVGTRYTGKVTKEAQAGLREAGELSDVVTKQEFLRFRTDLRAMRNPNHPLNHYVERLAASLDDSAISSGATDLQKAKDIYKLSKDMSKAQKLIDVPEMLSEVTSRSRLASAQAMEKSPDRRLIKKIMGDQGDEILDLLEANRILTDPSKAGMGEIGAAGLFSKVRDVSRRGVRGYEEKWYPKTKAASNVISTVFGKPVRTTARRATGLAERAGLRRMTSSFGGGDE